MEMKWLVAYYLGGDHPYCKELSTMLGVEMDPYSFGVNIIAAKGILMAFSEDFDRGFIHING